MDHKIIVGDCLDEMAKMPDKSVDLVFTSPPYEDCRLYGELGFKIKGQAWVDWCLPRFIECCRVCRGLVAFVVEGKTRKFQWSATPALLMADLHRHGVKLRKPPVFHRIGISGSGGREWLRNDYEFIVCASDGKLPWANNVAMGKPPKWNPGGAMTHQMKNGRKVARLHTKTMADGSKKQQGYIPPALSNPGNVLRYNVGGGQIGSKMAHENEAPFPEKLVEFFIRSFCPEGGIVLDPFSGSGTVAAVAKMWDRQSISIDVRQSQADLCNRRLASIHKMKALAEIA